MSPVFSISKDDKFKINLLLFSMTRPYGFGAWGYGSSGYMSKALEIPNVYGGYHYYGFHG